MKLGTPITPPAELADERDYRKRFQLEHEWFCTLKNVLKIPHADSYAYYQWDGKVLHHVDFCDGWHADPALIRGLTKHEVETRIAQAERFAAMFAPKVVTGE